MSSLRTVSRIVLCTTVVLASGAALLAQTNPVSDEQLRRTIQVSRWADPNTRPETMEEWLQAMQKSGRLMDGPLHEKNLLEMLNRNMDGGTIKFLLTGAVDPLYLHNRGGNGAVPALPQKGEFISQTDL